MNKIHQFKADFCKRNINIFVLAENDQQACEKIFNKLGIFDENLKRINKFIPLSFGAIITELDLDVIETETSKKTIIRDSLRDYDKLSIKIVCCGLAAHVNDFKGYSKTVNSDLFKKYHTDNLWNRFID